MSPIALARACPATTYPQAAKGGIHHRSVSSFHLWLTTLPALQWIDAPFED
jgi:hypothetical protein